MRKILYLLLVIISLSFLTSCTNQDDNTENSNTIVESTPIDFTEVKFESITVDYDGKTHAIKATNVPEGIFVSYEGNDVKEVGTHKVIANFYNDKFIVLHTMEATITINKVVDDKTPIDLTSVKFENITVEYNGKTHSIIATNVPEGVSVVYTGNDVKDVGTHTVVAEFFDNEKTLLLTLEATITINEKTVDLSKISFFGITVVQNGENHSVFATNIPEGVSVEYSGNNVSEVGEHKVVASFYDEEHKLIHTMEAIITIIEKSDNTPVGFENVVFKEMTVLYDGEEHSVYALNIPESITVVYEGNGVSEVGAHVVIANFYNNNQELVHQLQVTITIVESSDVELPLV